MTIILGQTAADEPSLFGWFLGFGIGLLVVLVVVVVVASILHSASRIDRQAGMATDAIDRAYHNTLALWDVAELNTTVRRIRDAAHTARTMLGG